MPRTKLPDAYPKLKMPPVKPPKKEYEVLDDDNLESSNLIPNVTAVNDVEVNTESNVTIVPGQVEQSILTQNNLLHTPISEEDARRGLQFKYDQPIEGKITQSDLSFSLGSPITVRRFLGHTVKADFYKAAKKDWELRTDLGQVEGGVLRVEGGVLQLGTPPTDSIPGLSMSLGNTSDTDIQSVYMHGFQAGYKAAQASAGEGGALQALQIDSAELGLDFLDGSL